MEIGWHVYCVCARVLFLLMWKRCGALFVACEMLVSALHPCGAGWAPCFYPCRKVWESSWLWYPLSIDQLHHCNLKVSLGKASSQHFRGSCRAESRSSATAVDLETQPPVVKHLRSCMEQERCDMDQGYTTEGWTRWAAWGCAPSRGQGKPASNWFLLVHLSLATTLESSAVFCAPQPQTLRIPITICSTHTPICT